MPATGGIKLADANLWLALAFSDHLHHAKAKAWFEAQSDASCGFCRVTQMALLRHLTNARIMGPFVQSQQDAWKNYDKLAGDPRVFFSPSRPFWKLHFGTSRRQLPRRTGCGRMLSWPPWRLRVKRNW